MHIALRTQYWVRSWEQAEHAHRRPEPVKEKVELIPIVAPAAETGLFLQAARVETMRLQSAVVSSTAPTPSPIFADHSLIFSSNILNLVSTLWTETH